MKLLLSKPRGFCAGVERAIDVVEEALTIWPKPIYVKHEIVHNRHVVDELTKKGAVFIEDLSQVPEGAILIYSAHGVSPCVREEAKKRKLFEIDATCPLVTKLHSASKRYAQMGYQIILIGHKKHVEVIGTYGEAPEQTTIIESAEDVKTLTFDENEKIFYQMQTTLSLDEVNDIVLALKEKYPQAITLPSSSICFATTNRQEALKSITTQTDLILVVGDQQSSNSNRLREVGSNRNIPSYLINNPSEINPNWLKDVKVIGMTAGASTPDHVVQQCIKKLKELGVDSIEEVIHVKENISFDLPRELKKIKSNV
ncbi:MAG: 4-hydroxy-3-methylbut-2-enyl diphosphate reductase [Chlamydiae bacterium]|nr:4-hydroxy-3-methylbut-2-enyl diphosphate reductase [Chlamydiota bacterium]